MGDEHDEYDDHDGEPTEDALEDELADATRPPATLPIALTLPALVLTAAIALPLHPDGFSFAQLLYVAFLRSPLEGLIMLIGFGSPFCFGAIVLALAGLGDQVHPRLAERLLVANLSLLHAQLLLVGFMLWSRGQGMMPLALLGFAAVSGGYFILHHAREAAAAGGIDDTAQFVRSGPTLRWLVRWGATVIVAVCGWIRLQLLIGVRLGWAIEVMLAASVAMTVLLTRNRNTPS
ncbi:hypothetical protein [Enhygromyxa salina]|uniref:Uncharacterized protein n=1 Tax=Enhygromyxa salina TaxID=215803 RepID=A0A2S9YH61_9BACT|nr:hypothetical protein [Enhygromyxa salina]PRQ04455.1 hypothetical protein ENSA7_51170 [Enhygromyxa salina]